jgi:hypothetical protein
LLYRTACGHTLPGVVHKFAGTPRLQTNISCLPLADQQRILDGEPLRVVMEDDTVQLIRAENLTQQQITQVFGPAPKPRKRRK